MGNCIHIYAEGIRFVRSNQMVCYERKKIVRLDDDNRVAFCSGLQQKWR